MPLVQLGLTICVVKCLYFLVRHRVCIIMLLFCFGGSCPSLKVREVKCVPGDPATTCPVLLSVRLLVYAGLSLFIISGPYLYMVVCVIYTYNLAKSQPKSMRQSQKTKQQTDKPKTALTMEKKKENKTHSPQLPALLYFAFKLHLHKLPRTKLTVK